jgi:hypothetical protein
MKGVEWNPPMLSFTIERHGGTVMGSSRTEVQGWWVDAQAKTVYCEKVSHRQVRPMQRRIYIKPLVESILPAMRSGSENELVDKHDDGTLIFPKGSAVRMTLEGRRKRLREAVADVLLKEGWKRLGNDLFRPPAKSVEAM